MIIVIILISAIIGFVYGSWSMIVSIEKYRKESGIKKGLFED